MVAGECSVVLSRTNPLTGFVWWRQYSNELGWDCSSHGSTLDDPSGPALLEDAGGLADDMP